MDIAARVRPKGQVTIPREIREALAIEVGDEVVFRVERDHSAPARVVLQAVQDDSFWNPPSVDVQRLCPLNGSAKMSSRAGRCS